MASSALARLWCLQVGDAFVMSFMQSVRQWGIFVFSVVIILFMGGICFASKAYQNSFYTVDEPEIHAFNNISSCGEASISGENCVVLAFAPNTQFTNDIAARLAQEQGWDCEQNDPGCFRAFETAAELRRSISDETIRPLTAFIYESDTEAPCERPSITVMVDTSDFNPVHKLGEVYKPDLWNTKVSVDLLNIISSQCSGVSVSVSMSYKDYPTPQPVEQTPSGSDIYVAFLFAIIELRALVFVFRFLDDRNTGLRKVLRANGMRVGSWQLGSIMYHSIEEFLLYLLLLLPPRAYPNLFFFSRTSWFGTVLLLLFVDIGNTLLHLLAASALPFHGIGSYVVQITLTATQLVLCTPLSRESLYATKLLTGNVSSGLTTFFRCNPLFSLATFCLVVSATTNNYVYTGWAIPSEDSKPGYTEMVKLGISDFSATFNRGVSFGFDITTGTQTPAMAVFLAFVLDVFYYVLCWYFLIALASKATESVGYGPLFFMRREFWCGVSSKDLLDGLEPGEDGEGLFMPPGMDLPVQMYAGNKSRCSFCRRHCCYLCRKCMKGNDKDTTRRHKHDEPKKGACKRACKRHCQYKRCCCCLRDKKDLKAARNRPVYPPDEEVISMAKFVVSNRHSGSAGCVATYVGLGVSVTETMLSRSLESCFMKVPNGKAVVLTLNKDAETYQKDLKTSKLLLCCSVSLHPIVRGTVFACGCDLFASREELRRMVRLWSPLMGNSMFPDWMSVRRTISFMVHSNISCSLPPRADHALVHPKTIVSGRTINKWLGTVGRFFGGEVKQSQKLGSLSLYDRRIVEIGALFVSKPRYIMLDNPTAGLVEEQSQLIWKLIAEEQKARGNDMGMLIATEDTEVFKHVDSESVHFIHNIIDKNLDKPQPLVKKCAISTRTKDNNEITKIVVKQNDVSKTLKEIKNKGIKDEDIDIVWE